MIDFALSTQDWMRLLVAALMTLAGLLSLLVPVRYLGMSRRPWTLIAIMLPFGLFGALGPLAHGFKSGLWLEIVGLVGQILTFVAVLGASLWLRARAKRHPPRQRPAERVDEPNEGCEIRALLAAGRKIEAIRRIRERTGIGLAEAKRAVENLQER